MKFKYLTTSKSKRWCYYCGKLIVPGEPHYRQILHAKVFKTYCSYCIPRRFLCDEDLVRESQMVPEEVSYCNLKIKGPRMSAITKYGEVWFVTTHKGEKFELPTFEVPIHKCSYFLAELTPLNDSARTIYSMLTILGVRKWNVLQKNYKVTSLSNLKNFKYNLNKEKGV